MPASYKGKILISTPDSTGDVFSRSVVLMIDHNEHGAFGLILNKKNKELSRKLEKIFGTEIDVYEGGPVENEKIFFIVKGQPLNEYHLTINEDFYLSEDTESIVGEIYQQRLDLADVKVFSGYSGWSAQQLENELKQKFWTVVDIYNLDYTMPNNQDLWKKIMQNLGGNFLLWANAPEDVTLN